MTSSFRRVRVIVVSLVAWMTLPLAAQGASFLADFDNQSTEGFVFETPSRWSLVPDPLSDWALQMETFGSAHERAYFGDPGTAHFSLDLNFSLAQPGSGRWFFLFMFHTDETGLGDGVGIDYWSGTNNGWGYYQYNPGFVTKEVRPLQLAIGAWYHLHLEAADAFSLGARISQQSTGQVVFQAEYAYPHARPTGAFRFYNANVRIQYDDIEIIYETLLHPTPTETPVPTETPTPTPTPPPNPGELTLIYPFDGQWLDFHQEQGMVVFSWTEDPGALAYRLFVGCPSLGVSSAVDAWDADLGHALGLYLYWPVPVKDTSWEVLARIGEPLEWTIASLDEVGGAERMRSVQTFECSFGAPSGVTLFSPGDYSTWSAGSPPTLSWGAHPEARSFLVAMARLSPGGPGYEDVSVEVLPFWLTEWALSAAQWATFPSGDWVWTVLGVRADGSYTGFTLRHFTKEP